MTYERELNHAQVIIKKLQALRDRYTALDLASPSVLADFRAIEIEAIDSAIDDWKIDEAALSRLFHADLDLSAAKMYWETWP